jgi:peptidyl-prolyl cis-trans isomerase C
MEHSLFADVVVNGEMVPFTAVAAETQNHAGPRGVPGTAWRKAADAIAIRTLLLQEAKRRGVEADTQSLAPGKTESEEEAVIRQLLDEAVDIAPPEPEAVRREWEKNPSRFRTPPLWEVSHILVACDAEDEAVLESASQRATAILEAVKADPGAFAAIAERESDCSSGKMGGFLGQMRPGDAVPEFEEALAAMAEGDITGLVSSRYGFHVIRLDALAEGKVLPFETVAPKIAEAMEKAAWAYAARNFVGRLLETAEITGASLPSR